MFTTLTTLALRINILTYDNYPKVKGTVEADWNVIRFGQKPKY